MFFDYHSIQFRNYENFTKFKNQFNRFSLLVLLKLKLPQNGIRDVSNQTFRSNNNDPLRNGSYLGSERMQNKI